MAGGGLSNKYPFLKDRPARRGTVHYYRQGTASSVPLHGAEKLAEGSSCGAGDFLHPQGWLTKFQFTPISHKAILAIRGQAECFVLHSFWTGVASAVAAAGWSYADIQAKGRWQSEACKNYMRPLAIQGWCRDCPQRGQAPCNAS